MITMESMTPEQKKQIRRFVEDAFDKADVDNLLNKLEISKAGAQQVIEQGNIFQSKILGSIENILRGMSVTVITDWQNFYQSVFGLTVDLSDVKIPEYQKDFDRILIIPQGLTIAKTIKVIRSKMKLYTWKSDDSLADDDVPTNDRDSVNGAYAVRIRDRVEADEELKNKSANDLAKKQIKGITLLERLVFELKYYQETGKHLDIDNWTLCSGSRGSVGHVPGVRWRSDHDLLRVLWALLGGADGRLRCRVVVSC